MHKNKIILLNFPPALDYSYENKGGIYPSAATLLIGTLLKNKGYDVVLIDCAYEENYNQIILNHINDSKLLYVGMSVMTTQVPFALNVAKLIKKQNRNITIIWGGVHPTLFPEQTLQNEYIDMIVINEGAFTSLNVADTLKEEKEISAIKGIGYKDKAGKVYITEPADFENINDLPHFDFSLINIENYLESSSSSVYQREFPYFTEKLRMMPILTGLGCAYRCEFCINVILRRRYRYRSAESIINEIKVLQEKYDVNTFLFLDEDFFINKKRVLEFVSLTEKEKLHFNWRVWCRVDHFKESYLDRELLTRLSKIGYGSMALGGESANQEILDYLKKGTTCEQIIASLKLLTNTHIYPRYSFMVGLENETVEQIKNTYKLCLKMSRINPIVDIAGPFIFRLYPGSPIYNRLVDKYNLYIPLTLEEWVKQVEKDDTYLAMPWLPEEIQKNLKELVFYSTYAFTSYHEIFKNPNMALHLIFRPLSRLRLKYFVFICPFEIWIHKILMRFIALVGKK